METEYVCLRGVPGAALLQRIAGIVAGGGLVAFATDTVYGVGCRAFDAAAEDRLRAAKDRETDKPLPLLAADMAAVAACGARLDGRIRRVLERFWPGALTAVLDVERPGGTVATEGFRVPDCPVAQAILAAAGGVMRVSSANRSGMPPACTGEEARDALDGRVALVLDTGAVPGGLASTVVRMTPAAFNILREGPITAAALHAVYAAAGTK